MKFNKVVVGLILFVVVIAGYLTFFSKSSYQAAIENFKTISVAQIEEKNKAQEKFLVYVGRESCPHCAKFAPLMAQAVKEKGVEIYYLNSEGSGSNPVLGNYITSTGISGVPALVMYSNGTYSVTGGTQTVEQARAILDNFFDQ